MLLSENAQGIHDRSASGVLSRLLNGVAGAEEPMLRSERVPSSFFGSVQWYGDRVGAWYQLILGALATWRITHLLNVEDGPGRLLVRLRHAVSGNAILRQLFDCFYCLSVWVAMPFAYLLGESWTERGMLLPALSAAAILVERFMPPMLGYVEDPVPDKAS